MNGKTPLERKQAAIRKRRVQQQLRPTGLTPWAGFLADDDQTAAERFEQAKLNQTIPMDLR
jgi:hypothetical protein